MRHFAVLGFSSHSKSETGEILYLGGDREQAIITTNESSGKHARKELFELANPEIRRHFGEKPEAARKSAAKRTASKKT